MRGQRFFLFLLLGGLALGLVVTHSALTQDRSGGSRGGFGSRSGRGGFGGPGGGDFSSFFFNRYSGGKDFIVIDEVQSSRDPQMKERLKLFAQRQGVSNGRLTREQFSTYMQERMAEMRANGGFRGGPPGAPPGSSATPTPGGTPGAGGDGDDERVRESFRRRDRNGDNILTSEETSDRPELLQYDKNRDGKIDLAEYTDYYKARQGSRGGSPQWSGAWQQQAAPQEEERRPVVYHAGKLPKGLPTWFEPLDTDKDGQVGLYEWKKGGRRLGEFQDVDGNGDGFITAEEALRFEKVQTAKAKGKGTPGSGPSGGPVALGAGPGGPSGGGSGGPPPWAGGRGRRMMAPGSAEAGNASQGGGYSSDRSFRRSKRGRPDR